MLRITSLSKSYMTNSRRLDVLNDIAMTLDAGTSLALTGQSGSGKSTLLHLIAGLETADRGAIHINEVNIAALSEHERAGFRCRNIGLVFQHFNLISSLTVSDNIAFQARLGARFDTGWQDHLLDLLGLGDFAQSYPESLSGGQQQRVAIGRALCLRPSLILADEPTGNLDEETGDRVMDIFQTLVADSDAAMVMVTHEARLAARLDRQLTLRHGHLQ